MALWVSSRDRSFVWRTVGDAMDIGERIKLRREEAGLSGAELARRTDLSRAYLSEIETGKAQRPSGQVLFRIASELGTTVADLLGKEAPKLPGLVSESLRRFAEQASLNQDDLNMLAQIRFRGRQPQSEDDWRFLYESIKRSVG
jgi:transcriptional regulator with XRE-family HTH domain